MGRKNGYKISKLSGPLSPAARSGHILYQHKNYEGHARDYEFSGTSMREHWDSGYEDTLRTLRHPEWLERSAISRGVTVHDLHREDPT